MAEYRRFIAYFYEYIDGKKQKNAGFAKVELRNGMWRILFRLTSSIHPEPPVQVYGFVREQGYLLGLLMGTMRPGSEMMEEWAYKAEHPIWKDRYSLEDLAGIWIQSGDDRRYITVWDDDPVSPGRFVLELPERSRRAEAREPEKNEKQEAQEILAERIEKQEARENSAEHIEKQEAREILAEHIEDQEVQEISAERIEKQEAREILAEHIEDHEAPEILTERIENQKNGDIKQGDAVSELSSNAGCQAEEESGAGSGTVQDAERQPEEVLGTVSELIREAEQQPEEASDTKSGTIQTVGWQPEEIPGTESGSIQDVECHQEQQPEEVSGTNPGTIRDVGQQQAAASENNNNLDLQLERKPDAAIKMEKQQEHPTAGGTKTVQFGNTIQGNSCPDGRFREGGSRTGSLWDDLVRKRPHFQPFEDTEFVNCIQIMPCDLMRLQQAGWNVGRSSFLLHGFYQYRHLLLGMDCEGAYIIGVPGLRSAQEQYMAKMFGFESFKTARSRNCRQQFGYWYRRLGKPIG